VCVWRLCGMAGGWHGGILHVATCGLAVTSAVEDAQKEAVAACVHPAANESCSSRAGVGDATSDEAESLLDINLWRTGLRSILSTSPGSSLLPLLDFLEAWSPFGFTSQLTRCWAVRWKACPVLCCRWPAGAVPPSAVRSSASSVS
jgi:hypothetical protein